MAAAKRAKSVRDKRAAKAQAKTARRKARQPEPVHWVRGDQ